MSNKNRVIGTQGPNTNERSRHDAAANLVKDEEDPSASAPILSSHERRSDVRQRRRVATFHRDDDFSTDDFDPVSHLVKTERANNFETTRSEAAERRRQTSGSKQPSSSNNSTDDEGSSTRQSCSGRDDGHGPSRWRMEVSDTGVRRNAGFSDVLDQRESHDGKRRHHGKSNPPSPSKRVRRSVSPNCEKLPSDRSGGEVDYGSARQTRIKADGSGRRERLLPREEQPNCYSATKRLTGELSRSRSPPTPEEKQKWRGKERRHGRDDRPAAGIDRKSGGSDGLSASRTGVGERRRGHVKSDWTQESQEESDGTQQRRSVRKRALSPDQSKHHTDASNTRSYKSHSSGSSHSALCGNGKHLDDRSRGVEEDMRRGTPDRQLKNRYRRDCSSSPVPDRSQRNTPRELGVERLAEKARKPDRFSQSPPENWEGRRKALDSHRGNEGDGSVGAEEGKRKWGQVSIGAGTKA